MRNVVLGAALVGGVALAFVLDPMGKAKGTNVAASGPPTAAEQGHEGTQAAAAPQPQGSELRGKIREVIDVTDYTYLRIEQPGQGDAWAAVPRASLKLGDDVVVYGAQRMSSFTSSTLKRTFDEIYFGNLEPAAGAPPGHGGGADPHSGVHGGPGAGDPHAGIPGAPAGDPHSGVPGAPAGDPHGKPLAGGDAVQVGKVAKADGPGAHTVAEIYAKKGELAGKPVRLRAVVVKSVPAVMGKTFLHVRDGSGDAGNGTHDLTVTTDATPAVGATVLVEGNLTLDKDFGSGYRYEAIVENARVVDG